MSFSYQFTRKLPHLSGEARLYTAAVDALRSHAPSAVRIVSDLALEDSVIRAALVENFLRVVRADMQRTATKKDGAEGQMIGVALVEYAPAPSTSLPGEGHMTLDAHDPRAQPRQSYDEGGGHDPFDTHAKSASPSSTELHGEGHYELGPQVALARSMQPNDSSRGQATFDAHSGDAPAAVAIPMPKRDASAMAAIQGIMAKSITFRLQDGRNIMDVAFHELVKIKRDGIKHATAFARESIVADYLLQHCTYANPDPHEKVGAYFPLKMIELAIAEADKKEAAHV